MTNNPTTNSKSERINKAFNELDARTTTKKQKEAYRNDRKQTQ